MKPVIPEWLRRVMEEAKVRVRQWPEGLRGPELQAIFEREPKPSAEAYAEMLNREELEK